MPDDDDDVINAIFTDKKNLNVYSISIKDFLTQTIIILYKELKKSKSTLTLPTLSKHPFKWFLVIFNLDISSYIELVGIDGYLFLRFIRVCFIQIAFMAFFGTVLFFPYNYLNGDNSDAKSIGRFYVLYLSFYHINTSTKQYLHIIFAYIYSIFFFYLMYRELNVYVSLAQEYYASPEFQNNIASRTVIITQIPEQLQANVSLAKYVKSIHSDIIPEKTNLIREMGDIPDLIAEHTKLTMKLETILQTYLINAAKNRNYPRPKATIKGSNVDSIDYYSKQINKLSIAIKIAREKINVFKPTNVGFSSFISPILAYSLVHYFRKNQKAKVAKNIIIQNAPNPEDINWDNARLRPQSRIIRLWVSRAITVVFCFVSLFPISALAFLLDVDNISSIFPSTRNFFYTHKIYTNLFKYILLPIIYVLFYMYVTYIFRRIGKYQGILTYTSTERGVFKKMYFFYIVTSILAFTLAGTIIAMARQKDKIDKIILNLPTTLIEQINNKDVFWISYILIKSLTINFELVQPMSLFVIFFKKNSKNLTPRQLSKVIEAPLFDYAPTYALFLWIYTLCVIYAVYSPFILPYGLLFFSLASIIFKYNLLYVYKLGTNTAGKMFKTAINFLFISMILFQLYFWYMVKVRMSMFSRSIIIHKYALPLPFITLAVFIALNCWSTIKSKYSINQELNDPLVGLESFTVPKPFSRPASAISKSNQSFELSDEFLHPVLKNRLIYPILDPQLEGLVDILLPNLYSDLGLSTNPTQKDINNSYADLSKTYYENSIYSSSHYDLKLNDRVLSPIPNTISQNQYKNEFRDANLGYSNLMTSEYRSAQDHDTMDLIKPESRPNDQYSRYNTSSNYENIEMNAVGDGSFAQKAQTQPYNEPIRSVGYNQGYNQPYIRSASPLQSRPITPTTNTLNEPNRRLPNVSQNNNHTFEQNTNLRAIPPLSLSYNNNRSEPEALQPSGVHPYRTHNNTENFYRNDNYALPNSPHGQEAEYHNSNYNHYRNENNDPNYSFYSTRDKNYQEMNEYNQNQNYTSGYREPANYNENSGYSNVEQSHNNNAYNQSQNFSLNSSNQYFIASDSSQNALHRDEKGETNNKTKKLGRKK
ncbi:hypothetical protein BB561_000849 [Smittium simulii]|uniref:CSC1/OSCA1-like 7TM region domain-containing protein n=1 Tax=Smittium simulii TaxID=133385 RepID=A0A2T9YXF1_9FUNG|nr:hypothetical protein BB561_000849 [Smittium simulii]